MKRSSAAKAITKKVITTKDNAKPKRDLDNTEKTSNHSHLSELSAVSFSPEKNRENIQNDSLVSPMKEKKQAFNSLGGGNRRSKRKERAEAKVESETGPKTPQKSGNKQRNDSGPSEGMILFNQILNERKAEEYKVGRSSAMNYSANEKRDSQKISVHSQKTGNDDKKSKTSGTKLYSRAKR